MPATKKTAKKTAAKTAAKKTTAKTNPIIKTKMIKSADTGETVTKEFAKAHPKTTYSQTVERPLAGAAATAAGLPAAPVKAAKKAAAKKVAAKKAAAKTTKPAAKNVVPVSAKTMVSKLKKAGVLDQVVDIVAKEAAKKTAVRKDVASGITARVKTAPVVRTASSNLAGPFRPEAVREAIDTKTEIHEPLRAAATRLF